MSGRRRKKRRRAGEVVVVKKIVRFFGLDTWVGLLYREKIEKDRIILDMI